jgi:hypothetical protein
LLAFGIFSASRWFLYEYPFWQNPQIESASFCGSAFVFGGGSRFSCFSLSICFEFLLAIIQLRLVFSRNQIKFLNNSIQFNGLSIF